MNISIVSIIIPVKNEENNIGKCLDSLKRMVVKDVEIEIIVVDNGSTDNTCNIINKYSDVLLLHVPGAHVSALRNYAARLASGELLAFVDADCVVESFWIENAIPHFSNEEVGIVGAMAIAPDDANLVQLAWNSFRTRKKGIRQVGWINSMNMFVQKDVFFEFHGFNEKLVTCEDVDLCYRVGQKYKILSDSSLIVKHSGEANSVATFFLKELWRGYSNVGGVRSHGLIIKELPSLLGPFLFFLLLIVGLVLLIYGYLFGMFVLVLIPLVFAIYASCVTKRLKFIPIFFLLSSVYFSARFLSIFYKKNR